MGNGIVIISIVVAVAVICVFMLCVSVIIPILEERAYLKTEMKRASSSGEYRYRKRQLKKLYWRSIPVVGRIIAKRK